MPRRQSKGDWAVLWQRGPGYWLYWKFHLFSAADIFKSLLLCAKPREVGQCCCIHISLLQCCTQILMQFLQWSMACLPLEQWKCRHGTAGRIVFLMTRKAVVSFLCSKSISPQVPVSDRVATPRAEVSILHNLSRDRRLNSVLLWHLIDQVAFSN